MIEPMAEDRFWALIASTTRLAGDQDRQLAALHACREELSADDVAAFEAAFSARLYESYSRDLWGAADVIKGGCSDEGFEYFRYWLASAGREVFEQALAEPDSLADVAHLDGLECEFESFRYVATEVWQVKIGRPGHELTVGLTYPAEPSGTPFEEEPAHLARR